MKHFEVYQRLIFDGFPGPQSEKSFLDLFFDKNKNSVLLTSTTGENLIHITFKNYYAKK